MKKRQMILFTAAIVYLYAVVSIYYLSKVIRADAAGVDYAYLAKATTLYTRGDGELNALCVLPATYFVALTGEQDTAGLVPAGYLDIDGYVMAADIQPVDYEPVTKYAADCLLTLSNDGSPVNLRARPDHAADNVLYRLPENAQLHYYGSVSGSAQVSALGDTWYYVRYEAAGKTYRGYVYTLYANPAPIPDNVVERVEANTPESPVSPPAHSYDDPFRAGGVISIIVIVCMSVPAVAITVLLYRRDPKKHR